jgi:hypothetical protein
MATFAEISNGMVVNLIEADSIMVLGLLFPEKEFFLEVTEETLPAFIGGEYDSTVGKFKEIQPYSKWVWDDESWHWVPPVPQPPHTDTTYTMWNDNLGIWEEFTFPSIPQGLPGV